MTIEQAALQTFTGRMAAKSGFTEVTKISGVQNPVDNTYLYVTGIIFKKPKL